MCHESPLREPAKWPQKPGAVHLSLGMLTIIVRFLVKLTFIGNIYAITWYTGWGFTAWFFTSCNKLACARS